MRINGNNTPLKIYDYLRSGKPIVATNIESHRQVLSPEVAVLVDPNAEAVSAGILSILEDRARAEQIGSRAKELFASCYPSEMFLKKTAEALRFAARLISCAGLVEFII